MSLKKRILNSDFCHHLVAKVVFLLMQFSYKTTKWKLHNYEIPEKYIQSGKSLLVAMWHDRLMTAPCAWSFSKPLNVLASAHTDGRLIAKIVENFGMIPVYGSTGKCSVKSLRTLIELCQNKNCTAIIPDGPRGPRHEVSPGIITIAKMTKTDILIFSSAVKKYKQCKSWDKFIIAYPFNDGAIALDVLKYEEIAELSTEESCVLLKQRIDNMSNMAKEMLDS